MSGSRAVLSDCSGLRSIIGGIWRATTDNDEHYVYAIALVLDLIATAPSVVYRLTRTNGSVEELHNPADMPETTAIARIEEPWIKATIMVPDDYLGPVLTLCNERRGQQADLTYVGSRAMEVYRLPLNEVVFDGS